MPASEAIASDVGHLARGVRYGLRPFRDLLAESVAQRHLWVELRPKKVFTGWTSDGGGLYHKHITDSFDGIVLDVVGVKTLTETLTRRMSGDPIIAGTYRYDPPDDRLYIHLTGDADPAATTVTAEFGIHLGTHGVYQPILLPDKLVNGGLDAWTGSVPDVWSYSLATGITLDKTAVDPLQGSYAARFTFAAPATPSYGQLYQYFTTLLTGQTYRASGAYRTSNSNIVLQFFIYDGSTTIVSPDGRTPVMGGVTFQDGSGEGQWRRFVFDFIHPGWTTLYVILRATSLYDSLSGTIDFDDVKLQPIARYTYYEPLLNVESMPTIEAARADAFWGEMSSALGSMTIANPRWESLLASYDWMGADAIIRVGGRFPDGNEILMEDCPVIS